MDVRGDDAARPRALRARLRPLRVPRRPDHAQGQLLQEDRAARATGTAPDRLTPMLYMIVEHFRNADAVPVYRRFRDQGRLAPDGLRYVGSWVDRDFRRCYQIMECDDPELLTRWMARWQDLIDFEVVSVLPSADAAAAHRPAIVTGGPPCWRTGSRRGAADRKSVV